MKALALAWQKLELADKHAAADVVKAIGKLTFGEEDFQTMLDEAVVNA